MLPAGCSACEVCQRAGERLQPAVGPSLLTGLLPGPAALRKSLSGVPLLCVTILQRTPMAEPTCLHAMHGACLLRVMGPHAVRQPSHEMQVDGKQISSIKEGLLCLIGVKAGDTVKDSDYM